MKVPWKNKAFYITYDGYEKFLDVVDPYQILFEGLV